MHKEENVETSVCAILILNKERTMCCNLAAAQKYPTSHFLANIDVVQEAKILYTTGHFIFSNNDVVKQLGSIANEKNIPFFFNLSAEYTMQFELSKVLQAIEYADFVLCNEHEAKEFAKTQNID